MVCTGKGPGEEEQVKEGKGRSCREGWGGSLSWEGAWPWGTPSTIAKKIGCADADILGCGARTWGRLCLKSHSTCARLPPPHLAASAQRFPLFHMPFILPLNAQANPDFVGPESVQLRKKTAKIYYFVKFYKNI